MDKSLLLKSKFQFVWFVALFHDKRGGRYPVQVNDDFHLIHVTRGTGALVIGARRYPLKRGVVISIPPFVSFYFDIKLPFEMMNIHYRVWLENGDPLDAHASLPITFQPRDFHEVESLLKRMRDLAGDKVARQIGLAPLAHEVVARHFLDQHLVPRSSQPLDSRIKKGYALVTSPDYLRFDSREVAKVSCLSVSQMNRIFRRWFRMSPHQLWEKHRFARICRQLRSTDDPIAEIAARNGFEDMAYLSKWFKKMMGCSPLHYRKNRETFSVS